MKKNQIEKLFPIPSQTSVEDKIVILKIIKLINSKTNNYLYLEIGSFLGGSLTPFLIDKNCKKIISIDKRNQILDDERNEKWSYKKVSEKLMIKKLKENKFNISKLQTFNGDISEFITNKNFDLVFIDGIHTDKNTFSDFLYSLDKIKKNSIILFHDSSVIFKAISLIDIYLKKNKYIFKIAKFRGSGITGIFFGIFSKTDLEKKIMATENFEKFYDLANENLLIQQLNNRIKIEFKISRFLKNKFPYKFRIKPKERKNSTKLGFPS